MRLHRWFGLTGRSVTRVIVTAMCVFTCQPASPPAPPRLGSCNGGCVGFLGLFDDKIVVRMGSPVLAYLSGVEKKKKKRSFGLVPRERW
jgi:hypothetical protein